MIVNLIDGSNIFVICYSIVRKILLEQDGLTWKDQHRNLNRSDIKFLQKLFITKTRLFINNKHNIICFEGTNSTKYRRDIYPAYKGNRPEKHPQFNELLNHCLDTLKYAPIKVMRVDDCEGDDCIYTLAKAFIEQHNAEVCIVSTDEDLTQIATYWPNNVSVLHPIKKEIREIDSNILLKKTLIGDSSDNIKFKNKLGPKTFEKMLEDVNVREKFLATKEDYEAAENIRKIVDLRLYPYEFRKKIIDYYNSVDFYHPDKESIREFFHDDWANINDLACIVAEYNRCRDEVVTHLDYPDENEQIPTIFPWEIKK